MLHRSQQLRTAVSILVMGLLQSVWGWDVVALQKLGVGCRSGCTIERFLTSGKKVEVVEVAVGLDECSGQILNGMDVTPIDLFKEVARSDAKVDVTWMFQYLG